MKLSNKVVQNIPWYMFSCSSLRKESAEAIIDCTSCLVRRHHAIGLKSVLKAVELPASIAHLATGLTNVDRKTFPHFFVGRISSKRNKDQKLLRF